MPAGPVQAAGAWAWGDDAHVTTQKNRYRERLDLLRDGFEAAGLPVAEPGGAFYLWVEAPNGDGVGALAERLATVAGALVSPASSTARPGEDTSGWRRSSRWSASGPSCTASWRPTGSRGGRRQAEWIVPSGRR